MSKKAKNLGKEEKSPVKKIKIVPAPKTLTSTKMKSEKMPKAVSEHQKVQTAEGWMRLKKAEFKMALGRKTQK